MSQKIILVAPRAGMVYLEQLKICYPQQIRTEPNIKQLSTCLGSNTCEADLLIIDYQQFESYHIDPIDWYNTLKFLSELYNKPCAKVAVIVDQGISKDLLQSILSSGILGVMPAMDTEAQTEAINRLLEGHKHLPKPLIDQLMQKKKPVVKKAEPSLTRRQRQVLGLVCNSGASNKVIARNLKISESTVKLHISSILRKFGVANRTQLALYAQNQGIS